MARVATISPDAPSLTTQAHQTLRRKIVEGELKAGERLRMDALQRSLGLSSTPLREALIRLTSEGFVLLDEGRGFSVAPATVDELSDITRLRLLLELEAFAEAIDKGDDEWEAGIVAAHQRLIAVERRSREAIPSLSQEWSSRHSEYHAALIAGCTSRSIRQICAEYFERSERYRYISAVHRSRPSRKLAEHGELMRLAIERRKKDALRLMRVHIQETADQVLAALRKPTASRGPVRTKRA